MLHLLLRAGGERYLLEAARIVEVLPLLHWTRVPQAPPGFLGLFSYHGHPVPLIDLGRVLHEVPTPESAGARILLVEREPGGAAEPLVGLLVSEALGFLRKHPEELAEPPAAARRPFARRIATLDGEVVYRLTVEELVSPELLAALAGGAGAPEG